MNRKCPPALRPAGTFCSKLGRLRGASPWRNQDALPFNHTTAREIQPPIVNLFFLHLLLLSLPGTTAVVLASTLALFIKDASIERLVPRLVHYSAGALLGAVFFGLLPTATHTVGPSRVFSLVLGGIVGFFLLEKLMLWRHCHKHDCEVHASSGPLLLVGDSLHNFGDGIVIAAAFMASAPLGLAAALSTLAHGVPKELGELVVYLHHGYSRKKAFLLNLGISLNTLLGALVGTFLLRPYPQVSASVMALSSAGFLYVALADLIPSQRSRRSFRATIVEIVLLAAGVTTMRLLIHAHG
jgi:zinc and cadmium transporter